MVGTTADRLALPEGGSPTVLGRWAGQMLVAQPGSGIAVQSAAVESHSTKQSANKETQH